MPGKTVAARARNPIATSIERQQWLEKGVAALRRRFRHFDYSIPENIRISIGWPRGNHGKGRAIGQCWAFEAASDKVSEIFISPELGTGRQSIRILDVTAHELVHATVGIKAGHKSAFKQCALKIGLEGPMTATEAGPEFKAWAKGIIDRIGPYPAGSLSLEAVRKKQSTRLLKCECLECDYVARVTKKWIVEAGAPLCPVDDHGQMICDAIEDGDDE